jgi:hypothetical protein
MHQFLYGFASGAVTGFVVSALYFVRAKSAVQAELTALKTRFKV